MMLTMIIVILCDITYLTHNRLLSDTILKMKMMIVAVDKFDICDCHNYSIVIFLRKCYTLEIR